MARISPCSFALSAGAPPSRSRPERRAARGVGKRLDRLALVGFAQVAFGRVAARRQRRDVAVEIELDRIEVGVDAFDHPARPLLGGGAHLGEERVRRGARESDAHVVGDAGLAGRVDLQRREFRHEHARFQAGAGLQPDQPPRFEELVDAVEDVEIDDAGGRQSRLARQPGEFRRRIAVGVVGEEGVGVEIDLDARLGQRDLAALGGAPQMRQRLRPPAAVEVVELALQSFPRDHRRPTRGLSASSRNCEPSLGEGRTFMRGVDHGAGASHRLAPSRRGMDAFAAQRVRGLHPGFREGRMGVDRFAELARGELGADRRRRGRDQFRGARPHRRRAEQSLGIGVGDPFDEAGRLAGGEPLAEAGEAELAGLDRALLAPPRRIRSGRRSRLPGAVKITLGTSVSCRRGFVPTAFSAATSPCAVAKWASWVLPVTSPMAKIVAALVRQ